MGTTKQARQRATLFTALTIACGVTAGLFWWADSAILRQQGVEGARRQNGLTLIARHREMVRYPMPHPVVRYFLGLMNKPWDSISPPFALELDLNTPVPLTGLRFPQVAGIAARVRTSTGREYPVEVVTRDSNTGIFVFQRGRAVPARRPLVAPTTTRTVLISLPHSVPGNIEYLDVTVQTMGQTGTWRVRGFQKLTHSLPPPQSPRTTVAAYGVTLNAAAWYDLTDSINAAISFDEVCPDPASSAGDTGEIPPWHPDAGGPPLQKFVARRITTEWGPPFAWPWPEEPTRTARREPDGARMERQVYSLQGMGSAFGGEQGWLRLEGDLLRWAEKADYAVFRDVPVRAAGGGFMVPATDFRNAMPGSRYSVRLVPAPRGPSVSRARFDVEYRVNGSAPPAVATTPGVFGPPADLMAVFYRDGAATWREAGLTAAVPGPSGSRRFAVSLPLPPDRRIRAVACVFFSRIPRGKTPVLFLLPIGRGTAEIPPSNPPP